MRHLCCLAAWLACWSQACIAQEKLTQSVADAKRLFVAEIKPLLARKCGGCHGETAKEIKGEFDMRSREGLLRGGESGETSLVPGDAQASPLFQAVLWNELEMPPKENDRLNEGEIELLRQWITAGAPWPDAARQKQLAQEISSEQEADGVLVATSGGLSADWTRRRYNADDVWAFRPLSKPDVPWNDAGQSRHPVDAFINRRLREAGLEPGRAADARTLVRRASFDLLGLPPTSTETAAYVPSHSPAAFAELVDRLLCRPQYGEQWGRHWLDVVRYADSSGFSNDFARPNAWRYRDYVIRSLNADKPYDQFVREQLAGDEMDENDPEMLVAVGFLRTGAWEHTSMSVAAVTRQQFLDDVTNNVSVTLLGHELRCAKCHDHKFDPIPTRDFYRMMAAFASVQFADRRAEYLATESTRGFDEGRARIQKLIKRGGVRPLASLPAGERPDVAIDADTEKKGHNKVNRKRSAYLERELKRYQPRALSVYSGPDRLFNSPKVMNPAPAAEKRRGKAADTFILTGGSIETPGERVTPGTLSAVDWQDAPTIPVGTEGRRLALARWITDPRNPLTARVVVNRVWQYHFGKALAGNPNNFGKTGKKPTHPELLDFLADYLIEKNWSLKSLHRLIMSSQAYQRAGGERSDEAERIDPNNDLLAVFPPRRLSAEELRDAMLLVSGELNLEAGGIPARPEINMEIAMQPRHVMGSVAPAYQPDRTPAERNRRTIYAERIRTLRDPLLEVFNQPGLDVSCEQRDASSVTPQVFSLLNGQNTYDRAVAMAVRLEAEKKKLDTKIQGAFQLALGRQPTTDELESSRQHVVELTEHHRHHPLKPIPTPKYVIREMVEEMTGLNFYWVEDLDMYDDYIADVKPWEVEPETRALADLCLVLFNSNEFIYVY